MRPEFSEIVALWHRLWSRETLTLSAPLPERDVHPGPRTGFRWLVGTEVLPFAASPTSTAPRRFSLRWLLAPESLAMSPPAGNGSSGAFGLRSLFAREVLPPPPGIGVAGPPPRSVLRWILTPEKLSKPPATGGDHLSPPPE